MPLNQALSSINRLLLHFPSQHLRLGLHILLPPWLTPLIINNRKPRSLPRPFIPTVLLPKKHPNIPLLPIQHIIHRVRPAAMIQIRSFARNNMRVYMRDTLASMNPVLYRNIQARGAVYSLHHSAYAPDCEEEIACFGGGEV